MKRQKINLIILHGWASNPRKWQKVVNSFKALTAKNYKCEFSVHVPALPGFDPKKPISKPLSINDYSGWLNGFIKKNNLVKPVLVGHSNGGKIASYYASLNNKMPHKLILINSSGIPPKNTIKITVFKLAAQMGKYITKKINNNKISAFSEKIIYWLAGESDYYNSNATMKKTMRNMLKINIEKFLPKIKCPVYILWGKDDKITPIWMAERINAKIPNSNLTIIKGSHNLHKTNPSLISQYIYNCIIDK